MNYWSYIGLETFVKIDEAKHIYISNFGNVKRIYRGKEMLIAKHISTTGNLFYFIAKRFMSNKIFS